MFGNLDCCKGLPLYFVILQIFELGMVHPQVADKLTIVELTYYDALEAAQYFTGIGG